MKHTFRRLTALVLALCLTATSAFATDYTAKTVEAFFDALLEAWNAQEEDFTITYSGDEDLTDGYISLGQFQRTLSALSTDEENGDYAALNLADGKLSSIWDKYVFANMEYLNTPEELAYVQSQAVEIVDSLDIRDDDDLVKIKTIYAYMTSTYVYDQSLSKFSAYDLLADGTAVCQGYALLTNYLLEEAGLNARVITGYSQDVAHAWNQVEWEGEWYNLDTTWDSTKVAGEDGTWVFFMKNEADFSGHEAFSQFYTDEYLDAHPTAQASYPLESISITANGDALTGLVSRIGVPVQLNALLPQANDEESLIWYVDDPEIATISADGLLTAQTIGTTWVNVESLDHPEWVGAKVTLTTVDMSSLSSWAKDIVTNYYLAQMLPTGQCHDYQDALTRLDLVVMADQLIGYTAGYGNLGSITVPFEDIGDLSYSDMIAVLRCNLIGVVNGNGDNTFNPDGLLTREEAAAILVRVQAYIQGQDYVVQGTANFTDSDQISDWALETVTSAQEQGLLQGNGDGTFDPQGQMTREQMIVALARIYNQL